jgi:hypothetical protein
VQIMANGYALTPVLVSDLMACTSVTLAELSMLFRIRWAATPNDHKCGPRINHSFRIDKGI